MLLLVVLFVFIIICVASTNAKTKPYGLKEFYIVYAGKFTVESKAAEVCTTVSDRGGAGVIYEKGNAKFVIVSIYFNLDDANKVKEQIKPVFSDCDILKITAPKLSKSSCNLIEKQQQCKMFYTNLYAFCKELYNLVLSVDKGEVTSSHVYKQVMQYKQKFVLISDKLKAQTDNVSKEMHSSLLIVEQQISSFFNSAFIANSVAKNLKKLYVNSIIEFASMCESIK